MSNRIKYFAHILIVISFLLFAGAAYLNISEFNSYNPPKVISGEPTSIVEEPSEDVNTSEIIESDKSNNTEPTKSVDNTTKKVEVNKQLKSNTSRNILINDPNEELRVNMENNYSIDIKGFCR